jgi:hypothetical protein
MRAKGLLLACVLLCSCYTKAAMMTGDSFTSVQVGSPIAAVIASNGEPYKVSTKNGMEEYTYIERVTKGNELIYENHFIFYVRDGVIVGKTTSQETLPPFDLIYQDDPNHHQYP